MRCYSLLCIVLIPGRAWVFYDRNHCILKHFKITRFILVLENNASLRIDMALDLNLSGNNNRYFIGYFVVMRRMLFSFRKLFDADLELLGSENRRFKVPNEPTAKHVIKFIGIHFIPPKNTRPLFGDNLYKE